MLCRCLMLAVLVFSPQALASFVGYSQSIDAQGNAVVSNGDGLEWLSFEVLQNSERPVVENLLATDSYYGQWRYASLQEVQGLLHDAFESYPVNVSSANHFLSGFEDISVIFPTHEAIEVDMFHALFGGFTFRPSNYENFISVLFGDAVSGYGDVGGGIVTDYYISQYFSVFDGEVDWPSWEDNIRIGSYDLYDYDGQAFAPRYSHALVRTQAVSSPLTLSLFLCSLFLVLFGVNRRE